MNSLSLNFEWLTSGNDSPEIRQTMGLFGLKVGDKSLTRNEDIWSQTIRDRVLVSAYPLAAWIVSSWWRLLYEPLPSVGTKPSMNWRMAHELTAANQGFIWPRVIFASDTEVVQIWSSALQATDQQSVRYINSLDKAFSVNLREFEQTAKAFIESVLSRLEATGMINTPLANLWQEVQEEIADPNARQYRRREAELGFDPDECPENFIQDALELAKEMGGQTFSEVAPACSKDVLGEKSPCTIIKELIEGSGITGRIEIPSNDIIYIFKDYLIFSPWLKAEILAAFLRHDIDLREEPVTDEKLYDLLGIKKSEYEAFLPPTRRDISVAVPLAQGEFKFHTRKKHPIAKRFELARFIGDYLLYRDCGGWLANTDLRTSRQKYQRAFAAEFLCPLSSLETYLDHDYSESALEDAAEYFQVSSRTVESILINNGVIFSPLSVHDFEASLPY